MIRLSNVRKQFGRRLAVDDLTLEVERGETRGVNYQYADGHVKNLLAIEGTK